MDGTKKFRLMLFNCLHKNVLSGITHQLFIKGHLITLQYKSRCINFSHIFIDDLQIHYNSPKPNMESWNEHKAELVVFEW